MISKQCLMGWISETAMHAGAGSASGVVDLPIQRESHNDWPCVFGSSVKGALRAHAQNLKDIPIETLFGPEHDHSSEKTHAGALAIGDARLLLLPVRSLTGAFRWVTCPEVLHRLQRDAKRAGVSMDFKVPQVSDENGEKALFVSQLTEDLFLEEYRFTLDNKDKDIIEVAKALSTLVARDNIEPELIKRLTIVSDDMFSTLVRSAVPVSARIALDSGTKTVKNGQLWYEEYLPPETVLYAMVIAHPGRNEEAPGVEDVMEKFQALFSGERSNYLQVGGNETVGMGWCSVKLLGAEDG